MRSGMLDQLWTSIADAGRDLVRTRLYGRRRPSIRDLCRDLLSTKGEASGAALARELVEAYRAMGEPERLGFFTMLAEDYGADRARILAAVEAYRAQPDPGRGPGAAPRLRGAAPRAVPAHEHRTRRDPGDRRPAHAAAGASCRTIPSWRRSTPTCTTCSAAGSIRASSPSPGSTGTARPRCWRSSCATRRSIGCGRWRI